MIDVSMIFKDIFLNGTQRAFFLNGTIAILDVFNNLLYYEKAPQWFIGGCRPGVYSDGRRMMDCKPINGTIQVFFPPLNIRMTAYENATAPFKDEVGNDGFITRFFFNGTVIRLSSTG